MNLQGTGQSCRINPKPMTKQQLESIKREINKIYLFLIGHTEFDPKVVEIAKLPALAAEISKKTFNSPNIAQRLNRVIMLFPKKSLFWMGIEL
jgi:hypothetical protein